MESYGKLRARYYVIKTSGIFTKNSRILEIHDEGLIFLNLNFSKSSKGKDTEVSFFHDSLEIALSDRNDKDILVKTPKQNYTLACTERLRLITDLLYYKV